MGEKLLGWSNPLGVRPSFVIPILGHPNSPLIQVVDSADVVVGFEPFHGSPVTPLDSAEKRPLVSLGDSALYAFLFPDGMVEILPRPALAEVLGGKTALLDPHPFVLLDVHRFRNEKSAAADCEARIVRVLSQRNPEAAGAWAAVEGVSSDQLQGSEPLGGRSVAFADLFRELEMLATRYGALDLRLKLVRKCLDKSPKVARLVSSLGFRPDRLGMESTLRGLDRWRVKSIQHVSPFVMVLEASVPGVNPIVLKAVNPDALKARYHAKEQKPRRAISGGDYRYLPVSEPTAASGAPAAGR